SGRPPRPPRRHPAGSPAPRPVPLRGRPAPRPASAPHPPDRETRIRRGRSARVRSTRATKGSRRVLADLSRRLALILLSTLVGDHSLGGRHGLSNASVRLANGVGAIRRGSRHAGSRSLRRSAFLRSGHATRICLVPETRLG